MKTSNIQTTHSMAIIRGWIERGLIFRDGSTATGSIADLTVIGGTIIDNGDGTAVLVIGTGLTDANSLLGIPIQPWSGALSAPPTEAELEAILGSPADSAGLTFVVSSTTTGYVYAAQSTGSIYVVTPMTRPTGVGGGIGGGASVISLTSEGGWSWFEDPRALAHGSYTYLGYNAGGDLKVAVVIGGLLVNTITVAAALQYDDHVTPTFYVDPINDKLIIFYSRHGAPEIWMRVSTNTLTSDPDLSGGFTAAVDQVTVGTAWEVLADRVLTYPSPLYTNNVDGGGDDSLWLFYRCHVGGTDPEWHYNRSDNGGSTWSGAGIRLHSLTYSKIESDGVGAIHVACSDHPVDGAQTIYHLYRESAAWRQSDGTVITGMPFDEADLTLVWDGTGAGDRAWVSDMALDGTGAPVIVFTRMPSGTYDPVTSNATDIRYMYARWTGSAWSVHEIVASGTQIVAGSATPSADPYPAGLSLDHDDPQIVYCSIEDAGVWDMWKYVTADGGASFTPTQLTTTGSKNIRPVGVRNQDDIAAVWLSGTYTTYTNYSLGIKGYVP